MKYNKKIFVLFAVLIITSITLFATTNVMKTKANNDGKEKIRILCYGDSNTWGWIPVETVIPTTRYGSNIRWTGVLQKHLGNRYNIIEEGLNGRTAGVDDFSNGLDNSLISYLNLNGKTTILPILKSQMPVDLLIIMLGTNDVKSYLNQEPEQIADSIETLVNMVNDSDNNEYEWLAYNSPKILIVSPVPITKGNSPYMNGVFEGGDIKSEKLSELYEEVASRTGAEFFDASSIIPIADGMDGIHLSASSHYKLGKELSKVIKSIVK